MQITCPNCKKNFFVKDELIPAEGRQLQCGKCFNKWFFNKPIDAKKNEVKKIDKNYVKRTNNNIEHDEKIKSKEIKEFNFDNKEEKKEINIKKKKINIYKLILVFIITFVALLIVIETFKNQISLFYPNILIILDNLFQTLKDIYLFFKDLVR